MSIAQVVDHLYVIKKQKDRVFVYFLTNRSGYFILALMTFGLCIAAISGAVHLGWNGDVIAGMVGGSISVTWMTCYSLAEHITRFTITIDSDIVSLQRTLEGIPIGFKKNYPRAIITDLGMYPISNRPRYLLDRTMQLVLLDRWQVCRTRTPFPNSRRSRTSKRSARAWN
jgi:hypothetical protein